MIAILTAASKLKMWTDTRGQDLTEYALLGGFFAAGCAVVLPDLANDIVAIFSKVIAMLAFSGSATAPGG